MLTPTPRLASRLHAAGSVNKRVFEASFGWSCTVAIPKESTGAFAAIGGDLITASSLQLIEAVLCHPINVKGSNLYLFASNGARYQPIVYDRDRVVHL
jgi:hypothetical protein